MTISYDAQFDNVSGVVAKIFPPKGKQKGYTYSIKVNNPEQGLKKWLNDFKCINLSSFDEEPQFQEGVTITIDRLGLKKNGKYINAFSAGEPHEEINLDNAHEKVPEWVNEDTKKKEGELVEDEKHKDPEDDVFCFEKKMDRLKQAVAIIRDLSDLGQQAIAKEITRML